MSTSWQEALVGMPPPSEIPKKAANRENNIDAHANDSKPPSIAAIKESDDEGYNEFLALLASSPEPEHSYVEHDDDRKTVMVEIQPLLEPGEMFYDSPHNAGVNREVDEVESTTSTTSSDAADNNEVVESRGPGGKRLSLGSLNRRSSSCSDMSRVDMLLSAESEHSERETIRKRPSFSRKRPSFSGLKRPSFDKQARFIVRKRKTSLTRRSTLLRSMQSSRFVDGSESARMDQVQIIYDDEEEHPSRKKFKWWHGIFVFSFISLLVCLLQLFLPPPFGVMMTSAEVADIGIAPGGCEDGLERCICPRETICATDKVSIILLVLARSSAVFDYPLYMMLFLSKAHNLNDHMRRTLFREWIDFGDMHTVHKIFGIVVGVETMFHSFFHLLRWGLNNDMSLLWQTASGITGFIAALVTPLICWPMIIPYLKQRISFEVRKGLHYLFVVWAVALLYHAPSRIPLLIGIPALIYAVDFSFGYMKKNNLVEAAYFERYGENGVAVHIKNPKSWEDKPPTSYVYIMCPWISKYEWHAFTMFPEQSKENHSMLCIGASGDWTKKLYDKIKVPCLRQLYVHGPFMTEFSDQAITTSNAIAVATGVGITPTLSLMMNYVGRKRVNIIWVCRDPGLIEYILHNIKIGEITKNSFAFIFYTGQRDLALPKHLPANLFIFRTRPNLENTITGIVAAIHSGDGLPEHLYEKREKIANVPFRKRLMIAMNRVTQTYDENKMFDYAVKETERAAERTHALDLEAGRRSFHSDSDSESDEYDRLLEPTSSPLIPENQVSLQGFDAMISRFLGIIGEYSLSDMEDMFESIDVNRSGFIDRVEFSVFLRMVKSDTNVMKRKSSKNLLSSIVALTDAEATLTSSLCGIYNSSNHAHTTHGSVFGDSNAIEYMNELIAESEESGENPLEDWSLFYCGGSSGIKRDLKDISKRYNIDLALEKFDW